MSPLSSESVTRRRFLELLGASLALAGAQACAPPREQIVPYVRPPEGVVPGQSLFFATAHLVGGFADGVLAKSQMGRPTKIEGNPLHPASLGGTDAFAQASILGLYDPQRSQTLTFQGQIRTWPDFLRDVSAAVQQQRSSGGAGVRILTETITSPTFANQMRQVLGEFPSARWHRWQPVHDDNALAAALLVFGQPVATRLNIAAADVVVTLDADPLAAWAPGHLRAARELASRREPERGPMNRIYAVESTHTSIGVLADHRLALKAHSIEPFAWALASALGVPSGGPAGAGPDTWIATLADDLRTHARTSLVLAGRGQPTAVHALAHAINAHLGSVGTTVEYSDPVEVDPVEHAASLRVLTDDMSAGHVQLLLILGANPVYSAPNDIPFADALRTIERSIHLGPYPDETAQLCQWHVPQLHALETWSDARAHDGTATILQPLIAPLYQGWSSHEVLAALSDQPETSAHSLVKEYWQSQLGDDVDRAWRTALHDGVVANTTAPPRSVSVRPNWAAGLRVPPDPGGLELTFQPDPSLFDGRFSPNAWLMELPRPRTKLSWDNVALLSPATAQRLGLANEDVVDLRYQGRSVRAPVWVLPGHADDSIGVTLGYGRWRGAGSGSGIGFNAYALRGSAAPWFDSGLDVVRTGERYTLASTQSHYAMEGRDLVKQVLAGQTVQNDRPTESLYPAVSYPGNAWGMVIDQSACVGCNACIVACQAENNIPVVGKEEVARGREMLWLRLDTYFEGERAREQLVPCMHCENAPCEIVCPVGATVHSDEGLNDMVYNRCVGTRYCSNNCPYKVRHFNFFEYSDFDTPTLKLLRNPDVTVRSRGVMEKCTYCVQRIGAARIQAERENRPIADGEVVTACQAACPSGAIVFGNLNDSASAVARARGSARNYTLLGELNTRPRTTYQAVVSNPNPVLGAS